MHLKITTVIGRACFSFKIVPLIFVMPNLNNRYVSKHTASKLMHWNHNIALGHPQGCVMIVNVLK